MSEMVRLGELISTKKGYAFKSKWFSESGIPVVKATNFTDNSIDVSSLQSVSEDIAKQYEDWKLRTNHVVVQTVGSWPSSAASVVGKCIRVPEEANGALLNQNTVILNCSNELDENYLYYSLRDKRFGVFIENRARGSANQASITLADIRDFTIYSYELTHQARIGRALRLYDDLIENNKRRIELLEESARQLYKEWFVRFRFPGHEHVKIVDGVPEGWKSGVISDFYRTSSGGTPSRKIDEFYTGDINWVKTQELTNSFIFETAEKITEEAIKKSSAKLFPEETVLVAMYGATIGQLGILAKESASNQACCALIPNTDLSHYIHAYLFLLENKYGLIGRSKGAAQNNISQDIVKNYDMMMPPESLMKQFVDFSNPIFDQIKGLSLAIAKLTSARDILLPKLMSGEITV